MSSQCDIQAHSTPDPETPPPEPENDPPPDNMPMPETPPIEEPTFPRPPIQARNVSVIEITLL
jgi:hypothetical protein